MSVDWETETPSHSIDLRALATHLDTLGISHGTLTLLTPTLNQGITDHRDVFLKVSTPLGWQSITTEIAYAAEACEAGVNAPTPVTSTFYEDLDGFLREVTVWKYLHGCRAVTANTLTVRTAYMAGLNLGKWHRTAGWSGAAPFSTRPALQTMRQRVEPYGHLGQHLMGLAYNAADELNDSMTGHIKVPVHGDAHLGNLVHTQHGITLVDWETAMLAPREFDLSLLWRDLLLVGKKPFKWQAVLSSFKQHGPVNMDLVKQYNAHTLFNALGLLCGYRVDPSLIEMFVNDAETQPLTKFDYTHMFETIARARECGDHRTTEH